MKNLSFVLAMAFLSCACSNKLTNKVVGEWRWHQVRLKTYTDGTIDSNQRYSEKDDHNFIFKTPDIIFKKDGTGKTNFSSLADWDEFNWSLTKDKKYLQLEWTKMGHLKIPDGYEIKKRFEKIVVLNDDLFIFVDTPYVKTSDSLIIGSACFRK